MSRYLNERQNINRPVHGEKRDIRIVYESLDYIIFLNEMAPGEALRDERHDVDEIIFRISGVTRHKVGDEEFLVQPGDSVTIPAATKHACVVNGENKVVQLTMLIRSPINGSFFSED